MKKLTLALALLILLLIVAFFVLLSASSPDNAPTEVKVIDLADTYEK